MREYLIKISIPPQRRRELLCDFCGEELAKEFYASVYEGGETYVEEFLCERCKKKLFQSIPFFPFEEAEEDLQRRLLELIAGDPKGYIIAGDEDLPMEFLAKNPFLIPLWGEEI